MLYCAVRDVIQRFGVQVSINLANAACVSTANQAALSGLPVVDGYQTLANDRALLTAQTNPIQDGLWVVSSGAWVRPTDFATGGFANSATVQISNGTAYAGTEWFCNTTIGIDTIDTNAQSWILRQQMTGANDYGLVPSSVVLTHISDASAIIDAALASRYAMPVNLSQVPSDIIMICAAIAGYNLLIFTGLNPGGAADDVYSQRFLWAKARLESLQNDEEHPQLALTDAAIPAPATQWSGSLVGSGGVITYPSNMGRGLI